MIRSTLKSLILAGAVCGALASAAAAAPNPPASGYPPNVDLQNPVLTNTVQGAGTKYGTPATTNTQWKGVTCASLWTASSGSPTEVFSIEGFDAATNAYYPIGTTGSISSSTGVPQTLTIYPGVATSSLLSGNTAQNAHLPSVWRLKQVIGGTGGPRISNKIGCNYLN